MIFGGGIDEVLDHGRILRSPWVQCGFALAVLSGLLTVVAALNASRAASRSKVAHRGWTPLRSVVGGANVPSAFGRLSATWPFAVLDLGEARLTLRVRAAGLFGADQLNADVTEVAAVYPVKGRLGASGVGFTDLNGRDYYFWTSQEALILNGLSYFGFPVSAERRRADKAWSFRP